MFFCSIHNDYSQIVNFKLDYVSNYESMIRIVAKLIHDRRFDVELFQTLELQIVSLTPSPVASPTSSIVSSHIEISKESLLYLNSLNPEYTVYLEFPEFYLMKSRTVVLK